MKKNSNSKSISITKGLAALKTTEKKIKKVIDQAQFVAVEINKVKDLKDAKSQMQKIIDLIDYRNRLKSAIAKSNATTYLKVSQDRMLVLEAIERKSSIQFEVNLLQKMQQELSYTKDEVQDINTNVQHRLDKLLSASLGSEGDSNESSAISKPFLDRNEAKVYDPLDLQTRIQRLDLQIDDFLENVDVALSESNSTTFIEV